jgi:hypothetical protein
MGHQLPHARPADERATARSARLECQVMCSLQQSSILYPGWAGHRQGNRSVDMPKKAPAGSIRPLQTAASTGRRVVDPVPNTE